MDVSIYQSDTRNCQTRSLAVYIIEGIAGKANPYEALYIMVLA